jgi:hypothetical protein
MVFEDKVKVWYKSKTIRVNVLILLAAFLNSLVDFVSTGGAITFVVVINLVLRVVTDSKLKW